MCGDLESDGSCLDYTALSYGFVEDSIGNPWGDPYCWYSATAVCGPETSIPDRCCYEFIFDGVMCK